MVLCIQAANCHGCQQLARRGEALRQQTKVTYQDAGAVYFTVHLELMHAATIMLWFRLMTYRPRDACQHMCLLIVLKPPGCFCV